MSVLLLVSPDGLPFLEGNNTKLIIFDNKLSDQNIKL